MLDFCPFDFESFDTDNLAYELTFPKGWDWGRIKKETVVGMKKRKFINENDLRRSGRYRGDNRINHVILKANMVKGGKCGLKLLLELIQMENARIIQSRLEKELDDEIDDEIDDGLDLTGFEDEDGLEDIFSENDIRTLDAEKDRNGCYTFKNGHGDRVMYALPCCPHCHSRLPIGWNRAEDFGAISLMAASGRGKTTFLLSMMNNDWDVFRHLGNVSTSNGQYRINITGAHRNADKWDTAYHTMMEASENMCKKGGACPQSTDREHWIPPVFLNVQFAGHVMIIGIYDNSGENLIEMNLMERPNLDILLDNVFAQMYLFDPQDLEITLPAAKEAVFRYALDQCEMLPIDQQGMYQQENEGKVISGAELLANMEIPAADVSNKKNAMAVYKRHRVIIQQENRLEHFKEMYFMGIIIKSDLLEQSEEIRSEEEYDILFERSITDDMLDISMVDMRSGLVKKMIKEFDLFKKDDLEEIEEDFCGTGKDGQPVRHKAVSWHCISALGCDTTDEGGSDVRRLKGDYAPIRVAEPLAACILKRIADNGWL